MYSLTLSNGSTWWIEAGDDAARPKVDALAEIMQLSPATGSTCPDDRQRVRIFVEPPAEPLRANDCILPKPRQPEEALFLAYFHASLALARGIQHQGGLLLHAALAGMPANGRGPQGILLSAPGGTGKSTASRRLPNPWLSWSDDAALVVPVGAGQYRAHPWPTWSRFLLDNQAGGTWPVQNSIPLCACVFLKQAPSDTIEPIGAGKAASLLAESAHQINYWDRNLEPDVQRALRLQRFDAVCALAKAVPAHLLHISLDGCFWQELEQTL